MINPLTNATTPLTLTTCNIAEQTASPQARGRPGDYLSALKALVAEEEEKQQRLVTNNEMHDKLDSTQQGIN